MAQPSVTIFGGTGFIGRRLADRLVADGAAVRVVARHAGGDGLPAGAEAHRGSVADPETVEAAVAGARAVVNLVGILTPRGAQTYEALHVCAPRLIGEAAARHRVEAVVHVSALAVAEDAPAAADRSKAAGERALFAACPQATVLRPSLVYGPDDHFLSRFVPMLKSAPVVPLVGARTRFQPLDVVDMAAALAAALARPEARGRIYEVGGPETWTLQALLHRVAAQVGGRVSFIALPFVVAEPLGAVLGLLPRPPLTRDQVRLLRSDKVVSGRHESLVDLGVEPRGLESALQEYLPRPGFEAETGRFRHLR